MCVCVCEPVYLNELYAQMHILYRQILLVLLAVVHCQILFTF